jgi:hypothetical protein
MKIASMEDDPFPRGVLIGTRSRCSAHFISLVRRRRGIRPRNLRANLTVFKLKLLT